MQRVSWRAGAFVAVAALIIGGFGLLAPGAADADIKRKVSLTVAGASTDGTPIRFSGRVTKTPTGTKVLVQRRVTTTKGVAWRTVKKVSTRKDGTFSGKIASPGEGTALFRAEVTKLKAAGKTYRAHISPSQTVSVGTKMREVMVVGNNWDGTATIVDANTLEVLRKGLDLVPDRAEELAEIHSDPARMAMYYVIRYGPGEGNDQMVDDMFTTNDGRLLAVSRPSLGDVVWIDLESALGEGPAKIVAEQSMDGFRTDHMGVSPDGTRLLVSDSTSRQVIEYAMGGQGREDTGKRLRTFESGETPHENNYSDDGSKIYHASIGRVYLPGDATELSGKTLSDYLLNPLGLPNDLIPGTDLLPPVKLGPLHDALKGDRWFEIVDNETFKVEQRWEMGKEMEEAGFPNQSSAVRPMAIAPGERFIYFQMSFLHGLVEFDTQAADLNGKVDYSTGTIEEPRLGAVTRVIKLPKRTKMIPEQYVNDSAHHGLSMNTAGTTLCAAGTMDDYVAMVDRETGKATFLDDTTTEHHYGKPYWTTEGLNDTCWVSLSEDDAVAVIDFETGKELAYLDVGNHPQRVRYGTIPASFLN